MSEATARCERKRRARRRAGGVCVLCRFPAKGYYYCRPCRLERAEQMRRYYAKKKRAKIVLTS